MSRDHPRSRGVYLPDDVSLKGLMGSSPLARGLLEDWLRDYYGRRIIPARAGFTHHRRGSPPTRGIIPARAGFTNRLFNSQQPHKDHPRSRGVYYVYTFESTTGLWIIPARAGFTP